MHVMHASMHGGICIVTDARICMYVRVCMHIDMYVCIYVFMYVFPAGDCQRHASFRP